MKKLLSIICISFFFISCDPVASMDAFVTNETNEALTLYFSSSEQGIENETFTLLAGDRVLVQEGFDVGSTYLEPYFEVYDSIYVQNSNQENILIFKPETKGKSIYNISEFWNSREVKKRIFEYNFYIKAEDLD